MNLFKRLHKLLSCSKTIPVTRIYVAVSSENAVTFFRKGFNMSLTTKEHVVAHAIFDGMPNGPVTWTIADPAIATLAPSADGLTCDVIAVAEGSTTLTVTDGVVSANGAVDVTTALAMSVTITFDPAVPV